MQVPHEAREFFDLAMELDDQVFDLSESLEAVRDILTKLTDLYPEIARLAGAAGHSDADFSNGFSGG